jgi:hypothetical protein
VRGATPVCFEYVSCLCLCTLGERKKGKEEEIIDAPLPKYKCNKALASRLCPVRNIHPHPESDVQVFLSLSFSPFSFSLSLSLSLSPPAPNPVLLPLLETPGKAPTQFHFPPNPFPPPPLFPPPPFGLPTPPCVGVATLPTDPGEGDDREEYLIQSSSNAPRLVSRMGMGNPER